MRETETLNKFCDNGRQAKNKDRADNAHTIGTGLYLTAGSGQRCNGYQLKVTEMRTDTLCHCKRVSGSIK